MRDYNYEFQSRVEYIKKKLAESGCNGLIYGNSGGKDSALVGILCKAACDNTLGVIMPCESSSNYLQDRDDAVKIAEQFNIEHKELDLTEMKLNLVDKAQAIEAVSKEAIANIAPRLRMTALYLLAQSRNSLVVGTGNKCERFVGYFTKWGDGAFDINPIADLTVSEIFDFLCYLKAPQSIISKAPSAGLFEGQTDEEEMGVSYNDIEAYMAGEQLEPVAAAKIERMHRLSAHKRQPAAIYEK